MDSVEIDRLFARVADGDDAAVEPAFEALWPVVRRYCLKLLADEAGADDATQCALVKMFEQASSYDRRRPALGWALAFAYWECRTERRRTLRRSAREGELSEHPSFDDSPEGMLAEAQYVAIARTLIADLQSEDRALLEEQPEFLGDVLRRLSPAARRKRKQRLIERLRQAFSHIAHPGGRR